MGRRTEATERRKDAMAAERFRKLLDEWMADDSGYDEEAWPELKEGLDRNCSEYRKHFPEQTQDQPKATEG